MSASIEADTINGATPSNRVIDRPVAWWVGRAVDLGAGFVLVRSALAHLANPYFFLSSVYDYRLAGIQVGEAVAMFLPHMELVVGACLIVGIWRQTAIRLAAAMFVVFFSVQISAWLRGLNISCGCFGASGSGPIALDTLSYVGVMVFATGARAFSNMK